MSDSFKTRSTLDVGGKHYTYYRLPALEAQYKVSRLPFAMKILLENQLRHEGDPAVSKQDVEAVLNWDAKAPASKEIAFTPARTILQDFTGVPSVVDLAAMRDAMKRLGGDPKQVNPVTPAELVIDHSVQVDAFGSADAFALNAKIEFDRNKERYEFLRWGQDAFSNFRVVPPDTGIVHQVNLEYLGRVVFENNGTLYPDSLVGTDSHTTMINGLGILGWGVGGIEAEASMLGQPITMLVPQVVGVRLTGKLPEGTTATDLVLTITQQLRKLGVVGKFVEYFGPGLAHLPLATRATLANMSPEYGATCGISPIDEQTIAYLRLTGRDEAAIARVEAYAKAQGLWRTDGAPEAEYSDVLHVDMGTIEPSLAGYKRPQDRIPLSKMKETFDRDVQVFTKERASQNKGPATPTAAVKVAAHGGYELKDGAVVIAAITSCTNTSNPEVLIGAGLLARNALKKGLKRKPWVKTSLAPGSRTVTDYLRKAGLLQDLEELSYNVVGYGCTTCIGNSGPLPDEVAKAIDQGDITAAAVLSGNRNFEGRIHALVKMNYLASPPLVVAYALAGTVNINLAKDALGTGADGKPVYLKDIWPSQKEIHDVIATSLSTEMFRKSYDSVFDGDERWRSIEVPEGDAYRWNGDSTYIANPPFFDGMTKTVPALPKINKARCLALLGDSITTDHISPAGNIKKDSPAGKYLLERGVEQRYFNSYGSRRGNHEVMMRGTFANIRIRNKMVPGVEGGYTKYIPTGEQMPIYDAAMKYIAGGTPLFVIAGKEYGTGSSRDWAAKGTILLGVKAVLAESFERIHRSNLVGMGVLPLQFQDGKSAASYGLDGTEVLDIEGLKSGTKTVTVKATKADGSTVEIPAAVRIDTPVEWDYYANGGILQYVLRERAKAA
ncbi:MAG: aconitate hydratase AcnA [Nevskiaceae bacterium]|nr:MAG: aconitate hydratase AcnA [Nevskiaceae bacterium]TBR74693.1 MAG: aconitate hydratase AcnA [Nevskiaceae bacterium]